MSELHAKDDGLIRTRGRLTFFNFRPRDCLRDHKLKVRCGQEFGGCCRWHPVPYISLVPRIPPLISRIHAKSKNTIIIDSISKKNRVEENIHTVSLLECHHLRETRHHRGKAGIESKLDAVPLCSSLNPV